MTVENCQHSVHLLHHEQAANAAQSSSQRLGTGRREQPRRDQADPNTIRPKRAERLAHRTTARAPGHHRDLGLGRQASPDIQAKLMEHMVIKPKKVAVKVEAKEVD